MGRSCSTLSNEVYKAETLRSAGKDSAAVDISRIRIGPREKEVLRQIILKGFVYFAPADLGLPWDKRRLNDTLKRLCKIGLIERVKRGLYRVISRSAIVQLLIEKARRRRPRKETEDRKDSHETRFRRVADGHGVQYTDGDGHDIEYSGGRGVQYADGGGVRVGVDGPFLDNVDAYTHFGCRVRGDGVDRDWRDLVFFRKINWAEILYKVRGVEIFGQLRVYQKHGVVRVEWQPPKGFVRSNGLDSSLRMYWEMVLNLFKILLHMVLQKGPLDVKQRMLKAIVNAGLKQLIC